MRTFCLLFLGLLCQFRLAYCAEKLPSLELDSFLNSVIAKGNFVKFDRASRKAMENSDAISSIEFAGENFQHADGIYGSQKIQLQKFRGTLNSIGFRIYSTTKYKVLSPKVRLLSNAESLKRATQLRDKLYPQFAVGAYSGSEPRTILDRGFDCTYIWRAFDDKGNFHRTASLTIRKIDGKCTSYSIEEGNFDIKIKAPAALKMAKTVIDDDSRFSGIKLRDWWLHDNNLYFIQYDAIVDGKPKVVAIEINSETGKIRKIVNDEYFEFNQINWDYYMGMGRGSFDPHRSRQGIVYLSYEFPQSFGEEKVSQGFHPKLMLHDTKGNDWVLYSSFDRASELSILYSSPLSDEIAFGYQDQSNLYILNLTNGTIRTAKSKELAENFDGDAVLAPNSRNTTDARFYRFASGKTGYDVSREVALDQLRRSTENTLPVQITTAK